MPPNPCAARILSQVIQFGHEPDPLPEWSTMCNNPVRSGYYILHVTCV